MSESIPSYSELANDMNLLEKLNTKRDKVTLGIVVFDKISQELKKLSCKMLNTDDSAKFESLYTTFIHLRVKLPRQSNIDKFIHFFRDLDAFLNSDSVKTAQNNGGRSQKSFYRPSNAELLRRNALTQAAQDRITCLEEKLNTIEQQKIIDESQIIQLREKLNQIDIDAGPGPNLHIQVNLDFIEAQIEWAVISASQNKEIKDLRQQVSNLQQQLEIVQRENQQLYTENHE